MRHLTQYAVSLVLTLLTALPVMAQTENAAFYIYQNDGQFDGFFYDQVKKISYSKLDTTGVEHEDYVSQEIITADSTYRFMLTAIDSVSFVQPEIRLNPNLHAMDELGLSDYFDHIYEEGNVVKLYFKASLPTSLYPKEGEVLMGLDEEVYGHDGYFGKVGSVATTDGFVVCTMKPIDRWTDLFEQFITVEQVGHNENGQLSRRIAGLGDDALSRLLSRRHSEEAPGDEGNYKFTFINWSGRLQYVDSLQATKSKISVGVDINFQADLNVAYKVTWERFFMKFTLNENFAIAPSLHLTWEKSKEWNPSIGYKFPGIKFPAAVPIFESNPIPEGFVRIGGAIDIGLKFPNLQFPMAQSFVIDSDLPAYVDGGFTWGTGTDDKNVFSGDIFDIGDLSLSLSGFAQFGTKVNFTVTTNRWIENWLFASIGWEIYSGPKLEGEISLSTAGLMKNGAYGLMKDSRLEVSMLSVDTEGKASVLIGGDEDNKKEVTFWSDNLKMGSVAWYMFPDFDDSSVSYDEDKATIEATVYPNRQTFWSVDVGIGLYDSEDNRIYEDFRGESYGFTNNYTEVKHTFNVEGLDPGKYTVVPLLKTFDVVLPVKEKGVEVEVVGNVLKIIQRKFNLGPEAAKPETAMISTAVKLDFDSSADWLSAEAANDSTIVLNVTALDKETLVRAGIITVTGTFKDDSKQTVELTVMQSVSPDKPVMTLAPEELTVGAAASSSTVRVNSNSDDITCERSADWLTPTVSNGILTIAATTNASLEPREGVVTVKATLNGKTTAQQLTVTQQGVMVLSKSKVSFSQQGGIEFCGITVGGDLPVTLTPSDEWIGASYSDGIITVTAEPQYQANSRKGQVLVTVTVDDKEFTLPIEVEQKSYIVLDPATISAPQAGGVYDVTVTTELTDIKIQALNKWIGLALSGDRSRLTVSVEPNTTGKPRQGTGAVMATMDDGTILTVVVTVSQSSLELELSDENLDFASELTTQSVTLTTTATTIDASPQVDWLSTKVTGKAVSITAEANTTSVPRTGTVEVNASDGGETVTKTITVTQKGAEEEEEEDEDYKKLWGTWVSGTMTATFGEKGSYEVVETRYGGYTQSGTYKITDWKVSTSADTKGEVYGKLDETHTTSTTGKTVTNTGKTFWISADGKSLSYNSYTWTKE